MIINVGEGGASKAESLKYDNETSGLSADNVQEAIDELDGELETVKTSFQAGCNTIVSSITAQGVTPKSNSPADISTAINTVATNKYNAGVTATKVGTATVAQVLSGKTFTNSSGVGLTGTMADKGAVTGSIATSGGTYTIPAGYHNGGGKVTGATLAQLIGTNATLESAGNLLSGVTAYGKNGTKYTGSMTNRGAWTNTPTTKGKVTIPAGYHNGSGYVDTTGVYNELTEINVGTIDNSTTVTKELNKSIDNIQFILVAWADIYSASSSDALRLSLYIKGKGWKNFTGRTASATGKTLTLACGSGYKSTAVTVWYV